MKTPILRRIVAMALCMACANAPAFELKLSEAESAACKAEGGCVVISRLLMGNALKEAHDAGKATCEVRL